MNKLLYLFVILCILAMPGHSRAQSNDCFSAINNFSVEFAPQAIVSADFNGDGNRDLATANVGTNNVSVLLGTGTGSFSPAVTFPAANGLYAIISDDFNGDGKADLASVNGGGYQLLFGTGTGSFNPPAGQGMAYGPEDIVSGDFNGDGKKDLAVVNTIQGKNVGVLINNGNGTFAPEVTYSAPSAQRIAVADFNSDGKLDIVVSIYGNGLQHGFTILYGTGTGSFNTPVNYPYAFATGIAVKDFNGDGKPDVALASGTGTDIIVYLAAGTNTFLTGVSYQVGTAPRRIVVADFDNDGRHDLAVSNYSSANVSVLRGTGNGSFGTASTYSIGANPTDITAADFNGDNKADFAVSADYYTAAVLLSTAPSVSVAASNNTFCAGGSAILTASGANTYSWIGGPNTATYTVTPGVSTSYSVMGSNTTGCVSNFATVNITVKPLPAITFSVSSPELCMGDSAVISASGASTYTWNTGGQSSLISFIAGAGNTSSFSVSGTSTVTGCTATAAYQFTVSACTGLRDLNSADRQVIVFPNPAANNITIMINGAMPPDFRVEILDASGRLLSTHKYPFENNAIDISSLSSGMYYLRAGNKVQKLLKE